MQFLREVNLKPRGQQRGIGRLTFFVFSIIISTGIYTGYRVLPFYYYYFELLNQMEAAIRIASTETDEEIRKKLNYHIRKIDLPVGSDEDLREILRIEREGDRMKISLSYTEVFDIDFKDKNYVIRKFHFDAKADGRY